MDEDHKVIRLTSKEIEDLLTSALESAEEQNRDVLAYLIRLALLEARTALSDLPMPLRVRSTS